MEVRKLLTTSPRTTFKHLNQPTVLDSFLFWIRSIVPPFCELAWISIYLDWKKRWRISNENKSKWIKHLNGFFLLWYYTEPTRIQLFSVFWADNQSLAWVDWRLCGAEWWGSIQRSKSTSGEILLFYLKSKNGSMKWNPVEDKHIQWGFLDLGWKGKTGGDKDCDRAYSKGLKGPMKQAVSNPP